MCTILYVQLLYHFEYTQKNAHIIKIIIVLSHREVTNTISCSAQDINANIHVRTKVLTD